MNEDMQHNNLGPLIKLSDTLDRIDILTQEAAKEQIAWADAFTEIELRVMTKEQREFVLKLRNHRYENLGN